MASLKSRAAKSSCIVVADEASGTIYRREKRSGPLEIWQTMQNEEGRKRAGDLETDRGGRSFDSFGAGRHTMAREKSGPKTKNAERFARQLAGQVGRMLQEGQIQDYVLVAPPRFLGQLRAALTRISSVEPRRTVAKELTGVSAKELDAFLDK